MRFGNVIMAYFLIGALFWGAGLISWGDVGVAEIFIDDPQSGDINEETGEDLENAKGPIESALQSVTGGSLLAVWGFVSSLAGMLFWPITVLIGVGAPVEIVVLFGGTPTTAFYVGLLRLIRGSA